MRGRKGKCLDRKSTPLPRDLWQFLCQLRGRAPTKSQMSVWCPFERRNAEQASQNIPALFPSHGNCFRPASGQQMLSTTSCFPRQRQTLEGFRLFHSILGIGSPSAQHFFVVQYFKFNYYVLFLFYSAPEHIMPVCQACTGILVVISLTVCKAFQALEKHSCGLSYTCSKMDSMPSAHCSAKTWDRHFAGLRAMLSSQNQCLPKHRVPRKCSVPVFFSTACECGRHLIKLTFCLAASNRIGALATTSVPRTAFGETLGRGMSCSGMRAGRMQWQSSARLSNSVVSGQGLEPSRTPGPLPA